MKNATAWLAALGPLWADLSFLLVAAPHSAPLAPGGQPLDRAQLRSAVWLLREPGSGTREAADQALLPQLKNSRRTIELGSSEAIQHAAAAGLGVACLSRWVVQDFVQSGRLVVLRTVLPPLRRQCYWVVHPKCSVVLTAQCLSYYRLILLASISPKLDGVRA